MSGGERPGCFHIFSYPHADAYTEEAAEKGDGDIEECNNNLALLEQHDIFHAEGGEGCETSAETGLEKERYVLAEKNRTEEPYYECPHKIRNKRGKRERTLQRKKCNKVTDNCTHGSAAGY